MTFVVNMIPNVFSGESNQDSEPNLAIDPADPRRIAGSAFTPDPLGGANAPIFVSTNGGLTWTLNNIVPSQTGAATGDITLGFGHQGRLYSGILRRPGNLRLHILRTTDFTAATLMTILVDRNQVDQPYVEAARVFRGAGAGLDRVYVGNNDFAATPAGRTATVDVSLDGGGGAPPPPSNYVARRIEPRATSGQDLPPIRPAIHIDGTVYAAYFGRRAGGLSDVVVVRDDNWAAGGTQFASLADSGDGQNGQRIVTGVNIPFENFQTMGMERLVASDLSIAVDPRDSRRVWVAWGDRPAGTANLTLHVRRSTDGGQTWSGDLRTVPNAKAPVVCVNSRGRVAFLYQELTGTAPNLRWQTRVDRTGNDFGTFATTTLANVPANAPAPQFLPYLGDYMDMKSSGKDFCGIFSTSNRPVLANFPIGVTYQRNANFGSQTLFAADGVTPVPVSIDPFFFELTELAREQDVYVADWTDSPTLFDRGVEPSTEPVFYNRSDVWNRHANAPGAFDGANRPQNELPKNGPGIHGRNFAFARIRRRGTGAAVTVNTHFLVSRFGTGSNYQDADSFPDIVVNFAPADDVITMSGGYRWQLPATSSSHLCLAVEISTSQDPIVTPSLLGRAPGWPTTDLLVINDNNKAQRNMGVGPTTASGCLTWYALIHNAATILRDIVLVWERGGRRPAKGDRVQVLGGRPQELKEEGQLVVKGLKPGESRFVRVTLQGARGREDALVVFSEMVGTAIVNGFAVSAQTRSAEEVHRFLVQRALSVHTRAQAFGVPGTAKLVARARTLLRKKRIPQRAYVEFVQASQEMDHGIATELMERLGDGGDPFALAASERELADALRSGNAAATQCHHGAFLEGLDALLTTLDIRDGDLSDVCQNLRWQAELFGARELSGLNSRKRVISRSEKFCEAFAARQTTVDDYPKLMTDVLSGLREAAKALRNKTLAEQAEAIKGIEDPKTLQRRHWEYLDTLAGLVTA
jgi:hypothetical protein